MSEQYQKIVQETIRRQRDPRSLLFFSLLILVNVMWAFQFSGAKIAAERAGPFTVTFTTMALATLIFLPLVWGERWRNGGAQSITKRDVLDFVLLSLLGCTPAQILLVLGVQYTLASNAAVLTLTIPIVTAILATLLLGERMTLLRWISFFLAIGGVLMVSHIDWRAVDFLHKTYLAGNLLILGSCLGSGFYNSFSKRALAKFSPVTVLFYTFLLSDAVLLALVELLEPAALSRLLRIGPAAWLSLLAIAIFSLAISMILFFWVIQRVEVVQASLSIYLLPVFGVLISAMTLHEHVSLDLVIGAALVFGSTFLVTYFEDGRQRTILNTNRPGEEGGNA
jgi:drug/metabolite transporter (DMT)-like permease